MDAPRIQYARTADDMSIAYAVSGSGPPLVSIPGPPENHLQAEWNDPEARASIAYYSRHRTLIRFDPRGSGLSSRGVRSYTLDERLLDMEAVTARLGLQHFDVLTGAFGNHLAVTYIAAHPDQVRRYVAVDPFPRGDQFLSDEVVGLMGSVLDRDFDTFANLLGAQVYGWASEAAVRYSAFVKQCITQDDARTIYNAMRLDDVTPLLGRVNCPVLVVRHEHAEPGRHAHAAQFAAGLPDATLSIVEGKGDPSGTSAALQDEVAHFLGLPQDADAASASGTSSPEPELRALMVTDIESHTEMMSRLGDARGRELLREHERLVRQAIGEHGGREVKALGDGFVVSFASVQRALECAIAIQRSLAADDGAQELRLRIGVNAGEPISEDGDLFGQSVIAASRLAAAARGGEILVADVVRLLVAGKAFSFSDRGEMLLRGLDDPGHAYTLEWEQRGSA